MSVGHDPGDVREQVHPGILGLLIPHVHPLKAGPHCVQEYVGHHPEIVAGNPDVTVEPSQTEQNHLGLQNRKR